ncbi:serine/threonine-protein kinase [Paraliomyxa miuraensis]|uniref:serine/threonine-protein kinase n=1 Tax=Paraliomyxa miuraensis TaxID=376150 RepID=UPI00225374DA|nr:serine/threonine-protein kinase [Paraliomyxa miuraensis]MCX4244549.1 serine/threonine protein kinase [Paraliomyxa miuraensis]
MASLAGTQIDKYEMIEEVGHGGMAVVYRGLDRVLKREVAVKVLHPHLANRKESRLRLEREAIAVAKLRHENILEIFDYSGPEAEASYIVTEFIHGVTLKDWVDERLDPRPAVAALIVHRLCQALQHAHRTGIVHRDIKPENVMIRNDGVLKLMDFGIAQIIDNQKLTLTGQLIGSPAYMAPELISGRPLDQRTDLFSLGILLYQLATGQLPFSGRNPHEVLNRIADGDYPPAATICPLVDRDLEDIIALALASDPDERYQSVETFGDDLRRYLEEVGVEPTNAELGRYFREPQAYVVELDERVCTALTERAKVAAEEGDTARAIRQLGRVLELDASHAGATELLARLRLRERRNRRVLMAVTGLAVMGAVLLLARLVQDDELSKDTRLVGTGISRAAARDDAAVGSSGSTGPGEGVEPSADGTSTALATVASSGTVADDTRGTDDTGDDGGAEPASSGGDRINKRKNPVTPPPQTPQTTSCRLVFTGIALPTAQNLAIRVGTQTHGIEQMEMDVTFEGPSTTVRVSDNRYSGYRLVSSADCEAGPVVLEIKPRPARVKFEGPPDDAVVVCMAGCLPSLIEVNQTAKTFRAVPIVDGTVQPVKLVLKHKDFEPIAIEEDLVPGPQTLRVSMVPRKP